MSKKAYPNHKVMYIHGMEGSPEGTKGQWVTNTFEHTCNPYLNAQRNNKYAFEESVASAKTAIQNFEPNVVIGSSFGGAVTVQLMKEKIWNGPTVLLAPAHVFYGNNGTLSLGSRVIIIHSPSDRIVPYAHSLALMGCGGKGLEMWNASTNFDRDLDTQHDGNHRLHDIISDGMLWRACSTLLEELK